MNHHLQYYHDYPEWKLFFRNHQETVSYFEKNVREIWIASGNTHIHLDLYQVSPSAPTLIYLHGLSSCGRMMGNLVRHFFERGFNVVCPDFVGFGVTTKKHGSGTIADFIQNTHDTITYVKKNFSGPRYLTGISLGGALSYYAACDNAEVNAIASLCLMDLSHPETHAISDTAKLMWFLRPALKVGNVLFPNNHLPLRKFLKATKLSDDMTVVNTFLTNPLAVKEYTFRFAHSLLHTPPKISFENFHAKPILVLHGDRDRLIPEKLSRSSYEKIPGTKKYVTLHDCEHIPLNPKTIRQYTKEVADFFWQYQ